MRRGLYPRDSITEMLIQIGFEILRVQNSVKIMQMRERNGSLLHSSTLALRNARKTLGKGRDCSQSSILMKSKQESYRGACVRGGLCPGGAYKWMFLSLLFIGR